jgi:hypothetical protein
MNLKTLMLEVYPIPQYHVAASCGISPSVFSDYVTGIRTISVKHAQALAQYFECEMEDLI